MMLKLERENRPSITTVHNYLHNSSTIAYEKNKIYGSKLRDESFAKLAAFFEDVKNEYNPNGDILKSSSLSPKNAHLTIIDHESECIIEMNKHPYQTDSVHDFIYDSSYSPVTTKSDEVNVTITSTYDEILKKAVPICVSIMFGKTEEHYKSHFLAFLCCFPPKDTLQSFIDKFPGNTCDF